MPRAPGQPLAAPRVTHTAPAGLNARPTRAAATSCLTVYSGSPSDCPRGAGHRLPFNATVLVPAAPLPALHQKAAAGPHQGRACVAGRHSMGSSSNRWPGERRSQQRKCRSQQGECGSQQVGDEHAGGWRLPQAHGAPLRHRHRQVGQGEPSGLQAVAPPARASGGQAGRQRRRAGQAGRQEGRQAGRRDTRQRLRPARSTCNDPHHSHHSERAPTFPADPCAAAGRPPPQAGPAPLPARDRHPRTGAPARLAQPRRSRGAGPHPAAGAAHEAGAPAHASQWHRQGRAGAAGRGAGTAAGSAVRGA